jgi:Zn-dependent M28 family amino/carboxypeptidase
MEYGLESITVGNARRVVAVLASDSLLGREAGTKGGGMAAEYILSLMRETGLLVIEQPFMAVRNDNNWVTETDMDISGLVAAGKEVRELKNIIAVLPGTGDEIVVIGAHYDHMGVDTTLVGDQCYNGADDNASGVSAVVQIAKAMGLSGCRPRRSVVFAFWDGEEKGLLGSRYFVKKHPFIENIAAYMNFDMIGRGPIENPGHLSYLYTAANPLFGEWLRADAARYEFCFTPLYKASENLLSGSDNAPFARVGIPIVWYHTEGHPDYHRPSDTADKIDYPKLFDITRAAYLCAWRLANEVGY